MTSEAPPFYLVGAEGLRRRFFRMIDRLRGLWRDWAGRTLEGLSQRGL